VDVWVVVVWWSWAEARLKYWRFLPPTLHVPLPNLNDLREATGCRLFQTLGEPDWLIYFVLVGKIAMISSPTVTLPSGTGLAGVLSQSAWCHSSPRFLTLSLPLSLPTLSPLPPILTALLLNISLLELLACRLVVASKLTSERMVTRFFARTTHQR
jgi:hypothetical protein